METELERMKVTVTGDATGYEDMLKTAQTVTTQAAAGIASAIGSMTRTVTGGLVSIGSAALDMAKQWAGLNNLTLTGLWSTFTDGLDEITNLDRMARRAGASILDLRAGALYAGVSMVTMTGVLSNTNTKLNELAAGSITVQREFDNLAAVSGTTVDELKGGWANIYDAIGKIKDPTERAAQAFKLAGNNATEILDALAAGGAGKSVDLATRLGLGMNAGELESIREVQRFLRELDAVKVGVFNQAIAALAPIAAELKDMFGSWKVDLTFIKPLVIDIAEGLAMFGAYIVEASQDTSLLVAGFKVVQLAGISVFHEIEAAALSAINKIMQGLNPLTSRIGSLIGPEGLAGLGTAGNVLARQGGVTGGVGRLGTIGTALVGGDGLSGAVGDARNAAADARQATLDAIKALGQQTRETRSGQNVADFFERVRNRQAGVNAPGREPETAIFLQNLNATFKTLTDGLKGPIDTWRQGIAEMETFRKAGLFKGNADLEALSANKLFNDLRSGAGLTNVAQFAGAAEANSREAYSAVAQFNAIGQRANVDEQIKQALFVGNQQREANLEIGRKVLAAIEAGNAMRAAGAEEEWDF